MEDFGNQPGNINPRKYFAYFSVGKFHKGRVVPSSSNRPRDELNHKRTLTTVYCAGFSLILGEFFVFSNGLIFLYSARKSVDNVLHGAIRL